ncbi:thiol-disulfide oxidoreductase-associated membrane protein CcdA2 [Streptococcus castoreus]|uniref:thiol-disulfide oxidoreductase-associated membrane protein CcdA2 n=1 Tax=Streptococcus castoreus TaxID=254786 RepID=UPI0004829B01|nr:thiol-disulfide oxidoreductase-associated membrane protein CcdA2 [Streptococcus castoreus]
MTLSMILIASVFVAGLLSFFSPCIFPILPVYLGILLDANDSRSVSLFGKKFYWYGIVKTLVFIFGLSTIFVILGYGAGFLGNILYAAWFRYLLGILVIVLGIHQMELVTIKRLQFQKSLSFSKAKTRHGLLNAFLLGITFSFGWTPCVGPVLSSVLALVASGGSGAWQGGLLMFIYTLGLGIPFLLLSFASGLVLKQFNKIKPHMVLLKKIGGLLIIMMGVLLITGQFNFLAGLFG